MNRFFILFILLDHLYQTPYCHLALHLYEEEKLVVPFTMNYNFIYKWIPYWFFFIGFGVFSLFLFCILVTVVWLASYFFFWFYEIRKLLNEKICFLLNKYTQRGTHEYIRAQLHTLHIFINDCTIFFRVNK